MRIGWFYLASRPIITACKAQIFTWIAEGNDTAPALAGVTGLEKNAAAALLDAMVSLELLAVNQEGRYFNTELAATYLVLGSLHYIGDMFELFSRDSISLSSGTAPPDAGKDHAAAEYDVATVRPHDTPLMHGDAVHGLSSASSMAFGRFYDFDGRKHLLDIAGGVAATAILAVSRHSSLRATVFDKPAVCRVARTYTRSVGLEGRIDFTEGDIFATEYPVGSDIHYCGNTLHGFGEERCRMVMRKSFLALPPGGELVFHDRVLEHPGPPYSPLLNAGTLMHDAHGLTHAIEDYKQWMLDVGFKQVRVSSITGVPGFVVGTK